MPKIGSKCFVRFSIVFLTVAFLFSLPLKAIVHSAELIPIAPSGAIADAMPAYSWHAVSGATRYHLMAKSQGGSKINQEFTSEQAGCPSGDGICSVTPEIELSEGPCKWRVRGWSAKGYGPWSNTVTFILEQ